MTILEIILMTLMLQLLYLKYSTTISCKCAFCASDVLMDCPLYPIVALLTDSSTHFQLLFSFVSPHHHSLSKVREAQEMVRRYRKSILKSTRLHSSDFKRMESSSISTFPTLIEPRLTTTDPEVGRMIRQAELLRQQARISAYSIAKEKYIAYFSGAVAGTENKMEDSLDVTRMEDEPMDEAEVDAVNPLLRYLEEEAGNLLTLESTLRQRVDPTYDSQVSLAAAKSALDQDFEAARLKSKPSKSKLESTTGGALQIGKSIDSRSSDTSSPVGEWRRDGYVSDGKKTVKSLLRKDFEDILFAPVSPPLNATELTFLSDVWPKLSVDQRASLGECERYNWLGLNPKWNVADDDAKVRVMRVMYDAENPPESGLVNATVVEWAKNANENIVRLLLSDKSAYEQFMRVQGVLYFFADMDEKLAMSKSTIQILESNQEGKAEAENKYDMFEEWYRYHNSIHSNRFIKSDDPEKEDVLLFFNQVLAKKKDTFIPREYPVAVPGGYIIRGKKNNKLNVEEMLKRIQDDVDSRMLPLTMHFVEDTNVGLRGTLDAFEKNYTLDEVVSDSALQDQAWESLFADPVLFVTKKDEKKYVQTDTFLSNSLSGSFVTLLALISALAFSLGPWSLNSSVMQKLLDDQTVTVEYLDSLLWPTLSAFLFIQLSHEASQIIVAKVKNFKTSTPLLFPSLSLGFFPSITRLESPPKDRLALYDYAVSGPLVGITVSTVFLISGLVMGLGVDVSSLPCLPAGILRR